MKTFIINGTHLTSLDEFYKQIDRLFIKDNLIFGKNLDAFHDVLRGGFGSFGLGEEITIIWKDFEKSKKYLENIDVLEKIITEHKHITFQKA